jgi:hypothetical protein
LVGGIMLILAGYFIYNAKRKKAEKKAE